MRPPPGAIRVVLGMDVKRPLGAGDRGTWEGVMVEHDGFESLG